MTAVVLLSIDPMLAIASLAPFPVIVWLVQLGALAAAAQLSLVGRGLGRNDQRAGRHDSRHPRGQGVCPGASRDRAVRPQQRPRGRGQSAGQLRLVVFRADGETVHRTRAVGRLGLRLLAGVPQCRHGRGAHRVCGLHRPLFHADRIDDPHGAGHAAGGRRGAANLRDSRPRAERRRAGSPRASGSAGGRDRAARRAVPLRHPRGDCMASTWRSGPAR